VLPEEPLDAALADAVKLGQLPLRRTRDEGIDEPFRVDLGESFAHPPLSGAASRADAERRFVGSRLGLPELLHRADQHVCEVLTV
jgi:hypothetical protein